MSRRAFWISLGVIAAVVLGMAITAVRFPPHTEWDVCYEMANARIGWEGAGYSGIYGK